MTEKMPSSVSVGSRPSARTMRSYSSGLRPWRSSTLDSTGLMIGSAETGRRARRATAAAASTDDDQPAAGLRRAAARPSAPSAMTAEPRGAEQDDLCDARAVLVSHAVPRSATAPWLESALTTDSNRTRPSALPSAGSHARSGCGIRPTTLRCSLQMPAMLFSAPLGLAASVICPRGVAVPEDHAARGLELADDLAAPRSSCLPRARSGCAGPAPSTRAT